MRRFPAMELIPAIDLRDGRCVRLLKGDFAAETVYADDPQGVLDRYRSFGARRVTSSISTGRAMVSHGIAQ